MMGTFLWRVVVSVLLLITGLIQLCLCTSSNSSSGWCFESERLALLKFKLSFIQDDPSAGILSSWQGNHCCQWEGVGCDDNTGHVTMLNLRVPEVIEGYSIFTGQLRARELNSSLVELQHLSYLDLGGNDFQESNIPSFLGSMKHLRFLGLSDASFSGTIPGELGNLSSLQHLELGSWGELRVESLEWASNLLSLKYLDILGVNMRKVESITMKVLATLPSLTNLTLIGCELQNIEFDHTSSSSSSVNSTFFTSLQYLDLSSNWLTKPQSLVSVLRNMTSLKILHLSHNNFNYSSVPSFLYSLKKLVHLDLSWNSFNRFEEGGLMSMLDGVCSLKSLDLSDNQIQSLVSETNNSYNTSSHCANYDLVFLDLSYNSLYGPLPLLFEKLTSLTYLDLANNTLTGPIPELSCNLKHLDLSRNYFYGPFPQSFEKLTSLTSLNLAYNNLNGTIPDSLGKLLSLEELDLRRNELVGRIPESVGDLSFLTQLDFSHNKLTGVVPKSLGNLTRLVNLNVSSNSLQGIVSEAHFANLSNLRYLRIGDNNLSCKMRSDWIPPFSLLTVHMGGCKVGSGFPEWLRTQNELTALNLSNADIVATFPIWLQDRPLTRLDLSTNRISGPITSYFDSVTNLSYMLILLLGSNHITGSIPKQLCKFERLHILDLSRNMLSGEIPDCWREENDLQFLNLSDNELSGTIPNSIGNMSYLNLFHINNNNLSGDLPISLGNCKELRVVDLGRNQFSGVIPDWIVNSFKNLKILRLRDNKFAGNITKELCMLSDLHILDLANNYLDGEIPLCFNNLTGMTVDANFELFGNQLNKEKVSVVMKGIELEYTSNLRFLNNMDLSCNHLHGVIPKELFALVKLTGLNLSYNHLSGNIPNQIGNLMSIESLDLSNNNLSGHIPSTLSIPTTLSHLNLSYNNLSGRVPTGNQLQTLNVDPSIYAGNPQLCGDTLPHKCSDDHTINGGESSSTSHEKEEDEEDKSEMIWLYFSISLGYATGLWVVMMTLCLKRKWRIAYFRFAENGRDRIMVIAAVNLARLKRMMNKGDE